MKNIITVTTTILLFVSCSGSDELTTLKAESIIKKCIKKGALNGNYKLELGNKIPISKKANKLADILVKKGVLINNKNSKNHHLNDIQLTGKKDPLFLGTEEIIGKKTGKIYTMALFKTCDYKFLQLIEVKETPSLNEATAKVKLEVINKTELFEFDKNKSDIFIKEITLRKTTEGWKLCD